MSNPFTRYNNLLRNALAALALMTTASSVCGTVVGTHLINGDGTVTYSYVIDNSAGSFDVAAWALEFGFPSPDWNQSDTFGGGDVTVPNIDWLAEAGTPVLGQSGQDFLALNAAGDVGVGQSLWGFSFTSRFLPGTITYHEFSAGGESRTGTTIGPVSAVPEGNGPLASIALASIVVFATATRKSRCQ